MKSSLVPFVSQLNAFFLSPSCSAIISITSSEQHSDGKPSTNALDVMASNGVVLNHQRVSSQYPGLGDESVMNGFEAQRETALGVSSGKATIDISSLPVTSMGPKEVTQFFTASTHKSDDGSTLQAEDTRPIDFIRDIDQEKVGNVLYVSDYAKDIMEDLFTNESVMTINPEYMKEVQLEITSNMRAILVDWLVDVSEGVQATSDTLYITTGLMDRFLSLEPVGREYLQLVGLTCFFIASKVDEVYAVRARDLAAMSNNTCSEANASLLFIGIQSFLDKTHLGFYPPFVETRRLN